MFKKTKRMEITRKKVAEKYLSVLPTRIVAPQMFQLSPSELDIDSEEFKFAIENELIIAREDKQGHTHYSASVELTREMLRFIKLSKDGFNFWQDEVFKMLKDYSSQLWEGQQHNVLDWIDFLKSWVRGNKIDLDGISIPRLVQILAVSGVLKVENLRNAPDGYWLIIEDNRGYQDKYEPDSIEYLTAQTKLKDAQHENDVSQFRQNKVQQYRSRNSTKAKF